MADRGRVSVDAGRETLRGRVTAGMGNCVALPKTRKAAIIKFCAAVIEGGTAISGSEDESDEDESEGTGGTLGSITAGPAAE